MLQTFVMFYPCFRQKLRLYIPGYDNSGDSGGQWLRQLRQFSEYFAYNMKLCMQKIHWAGETNVTSGDHKCHYLLWVNEENEE